jgi:hypothetical protein
MPKILNARNINRSDYPNAVYCGRPSKWGNPFKMVEGGREQSIKKHRDWVYSQPEFIRQIETELEGKDLICWCKPKSCHCDVYLDIANKGILSFVP